MPLSAASRIDFEAALNPDQLAAVVHDGGPQLVLAGAGSGKTRVITYRIAWLAQERGVDPRHIAAVTFTNKAAREMTARIERLLGGARVGFLGTFHRFSLRLLRIYGDRLELPPDFAIFDTADQKALIKQSILESGLDPHAFTVGTVLNTISHAKNRLINPSDFEREADSFSLRSQAKAYRRYQKLLREAGGVDFDDMIRFAVRLLREHASVRARVRERHRVLLVDEFQDTNHAQMALVDALAGERGALTAVGDEDQGIYRWRGAELDNILRFEDHFPGATVRKLEQNYRSTQVILDAAGAVVAHNEGRRGKRLWTDRRGGDALQLYQARDEQDEARWLTRALLALEIPRTELAVLVRTNAQTRAFEEALLERRVPYVMIGGLRFYERAEVKDLLAYLRLLRNPDDPLSFNRVLNKPPRGIGRTTHDALLHRALALDATPWSLIDDDRLGDLPKRARKALLGFRDLVRALRALAAEGPPLPKLLRAVIKATNYTDLYSKPTDENQAKLENINELLSAAQTFAEQRSADDAAGSDLLTAFLDHVSLVAEGDENRRDEPLPDEGAVSLMTMHSAKGLEFGAVAVAGLENGLLPHFNAQKDANDVEEERRLLYVAMTRAKDHLFLGVCRRRRVAGAYQDQTPSPFLREIPEELVEIEESPQLFERSGGYGSSGYGSSGYGSSGYGVSRGGGSAQRGGTSLGRDAANVLSFFGGGDEDDAAGGADGDASAILSDVEPDDASNVMGFFNRDGGGGQRDGGQRDGGQRDDSQPHGGRAAAQRQGSLFPEAKPADAPKKAAAPKKMTKRAAPRPARAQASGGAAGAIPKGTRVRHSKLGVGTLLTYEGDGDKLRYVVYFDGVGRRKLVAKFAKLDIVR